MQKSKSTGNGQTILTNRGCSEHDFGDNSQEMSFLLSGEMEKPKVCSIKDLEGILARPGHKPVSLAEMDVSIVFGALGRGKSKS